MIQFAINKAYFLQALHTTRRAISSKNAIPILSTIKIEVTSDGIYLTGSNGQISIENSISVSEENAGLLITQPGSILLEANFFINVVSSLPDVTLTFEEIIAASRCRRDWLLELIAEDIISIDGAPEKSTFSGFHLARIRRAQRLSRDFEAGIPALGLIMRLLDEVEELRKIQRPLVLLEEE